LKSLSQLLHDEDFLENVSGIEPEVITGPS